MRKAGLSEGDTSKLADMKAWTKLSSPEVYNVHLKAVVTKEVDMTKEVFHTSTEHL